MSIEIRRFGVGHRRPEGPPGSVGLSGQPIHTDRRGLVAELAFARNARIEPHANPNTSWLIVIEGGGWVTVGEEHARVAAGEAILWPADVVHSAWTEHSEMRALVVEFSGADDAGVADWLEGRAVEIDSGLASPERRAIGGLSGDGSLSSPSSDEGEPA